MGMITGVVLRRCFRQWWNTGIVYRRLNILNVVAQVQIAIHILRFGDSR